MNCVTGAIMYIGTLQKMKVGFMKFNGNLIGKYKKLQRRMI